MFTEGKCRGNFGEPGHVGRNGSGSWIVAGLLLVAPGLLWAEPTPKAAEVAPPAPASATAGAVTPKPSSAVETWLAQVDKAQQDAFQVQVIKPFEDGLAELRKRYLASVDAAIAKASAANQLDEALAYRTERTVFAQAQNIPADDAGVRPTIQALRTGFRQQLGKLEQARLAKAKTVLASYDTVLDKDQTALTLKGRLDDALLLKNKREEVAKTWLAPMPVVAAAGAAAVESTGAAVATASTVRGMTTRLGAAAKENPYVNSLGMKFVPVPITHGPTAGQRILFSIWDTRAQDYKVFAEETKRPVQKPAFDQGETHPVVNVTWDDAKEFCAWLTQRERKAGKLSANEAYRLPSDLEWSIAVGLPEEKGATPFDRNGRNEDEFPWGKGFPPTSMNVGNYRDETWHAENPSAKVWLKDYKDGYAHTSPVGSYAANKFGLFDMGGNVWQWCEDWIDSGQKERVVRGAGWDNHDRGSLLSSHRTRHDPAGHDPSYGFRCVLGAPVP